MDLQNKPHCNPTSDIIPVQHSPRLISYNASAGNCRQAEVMLFDRQENSETRKKWQR